MKKICNTLMILSIIFGIIIMALCFIPLEFISGSYTGELLEKTSEMHGAPGSGELFAIVLPFTLASDFTKFILLTIFNILIPGATLLSVIILQVSARLFQIGENKKWKNIVSFILTVVSIMIISTLLFTLLLSFGWFKYISIFITIMLIGIYILEIIKMTSKIEESNNYIIVKNDNVNTTQN